MPAFCYNEYYEQYVLDSYTMTTGDQEKDLEVTMANFIPRILGLKSAEKEMQLAERIEKSGATEVEVVGRGGVITSKQALASSETVKLMRFEAKKIVAQTPTNKE